MQSYGFHDTDARKPHKRKYVSFGGPGCNKEFDTIKKTVKSTNNKVFFHKGATVLSEWNRYGTVCKVLKKGEKVVVMVKYYAKDIPTTWNIGGIHVSSLPWDTDPNTIFVIGHDSCKLKLVRP